MFQFKSISYPFHCYCDFSLLAIFHASIYSIKILSSNWIIRLIR